MSIDDFIPYNDHELPALNEKELVDAYRELRAQMDVLRGALKEINAEHLKRIVDLTRERDATRAAYTKVWNELDELRQRETAASMDWPDRQQTMPQAPVASSMGITRPPTLARRKSVTIETPPTGIRPPMGKHQR